MDRDIMHLFYVLLENMRVDEQEGIIHEIESIPRNGIDDILDNRYLKKMLKKLEEMAEKQKKEGIQNKTWQQCLIKKSKSQLLYVAASFNSLAKQSWNKERIVDAIFSEFSEKPGYLIKMLNSESVNILKELVKEGGIINITAQNSDACYALIDLGIANLILEDSFSAQIQLPQNIKSLIETVVDDNELREVSYQYDKWEKVAAGMIYYYGMMEVVHYNNMFNSLTNANLSLGDMMIFLRNRFNFSNIATVYFEDKSGNVFFINKNIENVKEILSDIDEQGEYKRISARKLALASKLYFYPANEYTNAFIVYLLNKGLSHEESTFVVSDVVSMIKNDYEFDVIQNSIAEFAGPDNIDDLRKLASILVNLSNNTSRWYLNGFSPADLNKDIYNQPKVKTAKITKLEDYRRRNR